PPAPFPVPVSEPFTSPVPRSLPLNGLVVPVGIVKFGIPSSLTCGITCGGRPFVVTGVCAATLPASATTNCAPPLAAMTKRHRCGAMAGPSARFLPATALLAAGPATTTLTMEHSFDQGGHGQPCSMRTCTANMARQQAYCDFAMKGS